MRSEAVAAAIGRFAAKFPFPDTIPGSRISVSTPTGSADAFLALALALRGDTPRIVVAVTAGIPDAERLADDMRILTAAPSGDSSPNPYPVRILDFPPKLAGDRAALGMRLKTLAALRAWPISPYAAIVVVPFPALADDLPAETKHFELGLSRPNPSFGDLCAKFAEFGYSRLPTVAAEGDWSVRGGIVDFWSPGEEFPVRAEYFGDDLESLRTFDAATQLSIARIDGCEVLPVADGGDAPCAKRSLWDDVPAGSTTVVAFSHNDYRLDIPANVAAVFTGDPAPRNVPTGVFQTSPLPGFAELGAGESHDIELFDAARARLERHLETVRKRGDCVLEADDLSLGFEIPGLVVVTKADRVFTKRRAPRLRSQGCASTGARLNDFEELEPGEYVVHVDHGVGKFIGSCEILVDGRRSEVFTIEYADGAKLHVPASHAHLLSRYVGVRGESVRLHRLDGKRWAKDKADAQKAVSDLASSLLETQARRESVPGFAYDVNCDGLESFEAAFPYVETADQRAAIAAVKKDLASTRPMDRLLCGDAGYGKTEVAMRAAYIAALNGRQVAVLAPTTVLAEQHFETFTARFDGTPVRIESVSRFQSRLTHSGTFARLASGACDIVIGTHAILSSKIAFHDLGLIIIDEEQRFGVRHKEFLKRLRSTADVLTLSATPIPRTLYLSMTGARDLSLLRTPPQSRVAVRLTIERDSDEAVRSSVEGELERGGQVYYLHNRVTTIDRAAHRLRELCPKARLVVAHGQMETADLARRMRDFARGDYDILLSTTIIESGIDIPRANTIIIDRADTFGLADLYQLRGRVGRSSSEGRAVLLLPAEGAIDSEARERLDALRRHGALGAGFNLAVRDLELRGAGNLLGAQQSGHIAAVGFALYCQLLKRTVAMLKGEKVRDVVDVKLNLDFIDLSPASEDNSSAASLPYGYVEEDAQRIGFLKRFAEAADIRTVNALANELTDRFGKMPDAARRLVALARLRVRAAAAGIGNIDVQGDRAVLYRGSTREIASVLTLRATACDRKLAELDAAIKSVAKSS